MLSLLNTIHRHRWDDHYGKNYCRSLDRGITRLYGFLGQSSVLALKDDISWRTRQALRSTIKTSLDGRRQNKDKL